MTEGCLCHAWPLARDLSTPRPSRLATTLAAWRAGRAEGEHHLDEDSSVLLFGVGLATLARIEAGEVEPDDALAERIGRIVHPPSERPRAEDPPPPGGSPGPRRDSANAAARPPSAEGPEDCGAVARPSFWLARGDSGVFHVEMLLDGCVFRFSQDSARQMTVDLWPLLAIAGEPDRYERLPRLARPQQER